MSQNNQLAQSIGTAFTKEDAYRTLEMINTWISNIDTKVSFALSIAGVLIGFVFSKGMPSAFKRVGEVSKLAELNGGEIIAAILVCALYIVSFISILYFMLAILARIKNSSNVQRKLQVKMKHFFPLLKCNSLYCPYQDLCFPPLGEERLFTLSYALSSLITSLALFPFNTLRG
jgi:hypothetical protein